MPNLIFSFPQILLMLTQSCHHHFLFPQILLILTQSCHHSLNFSIHKYNNINHSSISASVNPPFRSISCTCFCVIPKAPYLNPYYSISQLKKRFMELLELLELFSRLPPQNCITLFHTDNFLFYQLIHILYASTVCSFSPPP